MEVDEQVEKRLQILDDFSSSDSEDDEDSEEDDDTHDQSTGDAQEFSCAILPNEPIKINLDVSTLICLVSELTHGGHVYRYPNKWLEVPAELERASRLAPKLENYMKGSLITCCLFRREQGISCLGKELFICQTAFEEFNSIVNTVGGPNERQRAEELFKRVRGFPQLISRAHRRSFSSSWFLIISQIDRSICKKA